MYWDSLIIDTESQVIKPASARGDALRSLSAQHRMSLLQESEPVEVERRRERGGAQRRGLGIDNPPTDNDMRAGADCVDDLDTDDGSDKDIDIIEDRDSGVNVGAPAGGTAIITSTRAVSKSNEIGSGRSGAQLTHRAGRARHNRGTTADHSQPRCAQAEIHGMRNILGVPASLPTAAIILVAR